MRTLAPVDPESPPKIPRLPDGLNLTSGAKRRWRAIWTAPMASEYSEADIPGIARLVTLYAMAERTDSTRTLIDISRECRALESEYGCSPKSRSQMKYEIERGASAEERSRRRRNRKAAQSVETTAPDTEVETDLSPEDALSRLRGMA